MSVQLVVNRAYTLGFPGQPLRDGPRRAKPARIVSATLGTDPGASTNRVGRVFGYSAEVPELGSSPVVQEAEVIVGGANFFGILFNPQEYALYGSAGNALAPSMDLPQGAEGSFANMTTGLAAEIFNFTTAAETPVYGDPVGYVPSTITAEDNPLALPYGAMVTWSAAAAVPTGIVQIKNAIISIPNGSLAASAAGALVSATFGIEI